MKKSTIALLYIIMITPYYYHRCDLISRLYIGDMTEQKMSIISDMAMTEILNYSFIYKAFILLVHLVSYTIIYLSINYLLC